MINHIENRDAAIRWARRQLEKEFVIVDTETTGVDDQAEVCQIGVVSKSGRVLLDCLIHPSRPIPAEATAVHGISTADVAGCPAWPDVARAVEILLFERVALAYNSEFDERIMRQSYAANKIRPYLSLNLLDVMLPFASFYGAWSDYHESYTWQKLTNAAAYFGIPTAGAHGAAADALMTLKVLEGMAASKLSEEEEHA